MGRQKANEIQQGQMLSPAPGKKGGLTAIQAWDRLAAEKLCREGLEVLVDNELSISQQYALAATMSPSILGCMNGSTSRRRHCSQFCPLPQTSTNWNKLGKQPRWSGATAQALQGQDEGAQFVHPRQETALGHLIATPHYPSHKEATDRVEPGSSKRRMTDSGHKLKQERSRLDGSRNFFPIRTVNQWNRMSKQGHREHGTASKDNSSQDEEHQITLCCLGFYDKYQTDRSQLSPDSSSSTDSPSKELRFHSPTKKFEHYLGRSPQAKEQITTENFRRKKRKELDRSSEPWEKKNLAEADMNRSHHLRRRKADTTTTGERTPTEATLR
ncbi:hypothetical protein QYF61_002927 [Mycteria americana]|uniref:Uncharacterized protein n=1 Tax=Mycteria americana TaxID=33587 RepID=A0AAN7NQW4_MYCAM|nr:hypothetical protein QYF61_002927 [Mycteria americana]